MTAYESGDQRKQALEAGAVAFLNKPFDEEDLLNAIDTALKKKCKTVRLVREKLAARRRG